MPKTFRSHGRALPIHAREVNMKKEAQPITKADLDALKQAVGKVAPKAATAKARIAFTYTR
ncbi:hypothetical protein AB0H63_10895 [Micromonospora echinospora]|uniref:hypothetical protein n=1 Tax=Micromonospora echinospora TaxID=1877 RepID=UPI0033C69EB5